MTRGIQAPFTSLQWRHNERDGGSNHQLHDCLLIIMDNNDDSNDNNNDNDYDNMLILFQLFHAYIQIMFMILTKQFMVLSIS